MINRRQFLRVGTAGLLTLPTLLDAQSSDHVFHIGVIADSHIIDDFYRGPEGNEEDTWSIFQTTKRLTATRTFLNGLTPRLDRVFLVGDYFHDYPSADLDFYFTNTTRIDHAKALTDGFAMPVHVGFGNHDYAVQKMSREGTHELFRRKLGLQPYYAIDHRGFKFLHLNNFLGATWDVGHAQYNRGVGSLGETQLAWLDAQLAERRPTFVFVHFPLAAIAEREVADLGLTAVLRRHAETVQLVISGHWHRWVDVGREHGVPHLVIASTRYDEDAYLILEVDTRAGTHRALNLDLVEWNTHFSRPFVRP
jgi:hypothetical protein